MTSCKKVTSSVESRISYIDLLETFCICMVLFYHCTLSDIELLNEAYSVPSYIHYYLLSAASASIPLFFFINGFLLFQKPLNLTKHIKKAIRFFLQGIAFGILSAIFYLSITNQPINFFEIYDSVRFFKMGCCNHLWFLASLVNIYILFPLIKSSYDHNKKVFSVFLSILFIFTYANNILNFSATLAYDAIFQQKSIIDFIDIFSIYDPFRGIKTFSVFYFCLGGMLHDADSYLKDIPLKKKRIWGIALFLFGSFGLFFNGLLYTWLSGKYWDCFWNGYFNLFTVFIVIGIILLVKDYHIKSSVLTLISKNTLGIYLIHYFAIVLIKPYFLNLILYKNLVSTLLFAFLIMLISLFCSVIIKKAPILKHLIS